MSDVFPTPEPATGALLTEPTPPWEDVPQPDLAADEPTEAAEPRKPTVAEKLGTNTRRASGIRQLNKKDLDQLRSLYGVMAVGLMPIRPTTATAIAENTDSCVEAWEDLAKQNDSVRRALLALLEGGAWGVLLGAHLPIMWTLIPERALERLPLMFGKQPEETSEAA